jgi:elongator complex protein 3
MTLKFKIFSMSLSKQFILRLYQELKNCDEVTDKRFAKLKNEFSAKFKVPNITNIELIEAYRQLMSIGDLVKNKKIERLISRRKVRSSSGVAVITCQTKPFSCPGKCVYCPSEPNMPKSYLSNQPASMRAVLNKFDPFAQVQNRLASLMVTGHDVSKIEIIIIGGTWSFLPLEYQQDFIKNIYDGLNQIIKPQNIKKYGGFFKCPKIIKKEDAKTLEEAITKNETSPHRCVGLTLETRPDFINPAEIKRFRSYGCTRVELGVQSLFDQVHLKTKRGHTVKDVQIATKLLRDAGFKIAYHLMPGLPGSNAKMDLETVKQTFNNDHYKPDLIKFYPCVVTKYSELFTIYEQGKFTPLTENELKPTLLAMKKLVPRFTRIVRLVRDIPSDSVIAGCKTINLRQLIHNEMKDKNIKCQCIRCREIKEDVINVEHVEMRRLNYQANDGDEIFLSFDETSQDKLISLLRLRIPSQFFDKTDHFIPELQNCALIREIHTYGQQTVIGEKDGNTQHFGFGKKLLTAAEDIAKKEYQIKKIAVIAGTGVRAYYQKLGYKKVGTYMIKQLD